MLLTAPILALALALPSAPPPTAAPAQPQGPVLVVGKIREVRGIPRSRAELVTEAGVHHPLHAEQLGLATELVRLAGAKVRLVTRHHPLLSGQALMVDSYQILDVGGGQVPRLGHLAALRLKDVRRLVFVGDDGQADLLPAGWNRKLMHQVGAKLWLIGHYNREGYFRPARFAILRPAPPKKN